MDYHPLPIASSVLRNQFIKWQLFVLQVLGHIVSEESRFKFLSFLIWIVNVAVCSFALGIQITFLTMGCGDLWETTLVSGNSIVYINMLSKMYFFYVHRKNYSILINDVHCEILKLLRKKQSFIDEKFKMYVSGIRTVNLILGIALVSAICALLSNEFTFLAFNFTDVLKGSVSSNKTVPQLLVMFPNHIAFRNWFLIHLVPIYTEIIVNLGLFVWATFNANLMKYAALRIDIVNFKLANFNVSSGGSTAADNQPDVNFKDMLKKRTLEIIELKRFIRNYENISKYAILIESSTETALMCFGMYHIVQIDDIAMGITVIQGVFVLLAILFLQFWHANEISVKSNQISTSLYMSEWYSLPVFIQKDVLLFMKCCFHPITISTVLFSRNTDSFVLIMKTSYSYYTLLSSIASK